MLWANYQIVLSEQGAGRGEQGEGRGEKALISGGSGQLGGGTPQLITPQYLKTHRLLAKVGFNFNPLKAGQIINREVREVLQADGPPDRPWPGQANRKERIILIPRLAPSKVYFRSSSQ